MSPINVWNIPVSTTLKIIDKLPPPSPSLIQCCLYAVMGHTINHYQSVLLPESPFLPLPLLSQADS